MIKKPAKKPSKAGSKTGEQPAPKPGASSPLPSAEQILEFIRTSPGKVGKREIGKAFNIRGSKKIELKKLLRQMSDDGLLEGRRRKLNDSSGLPPVVVADIIAINDDGEAVAVPYEWNEAGSAPPPRIIIKPRRGNSRRADQQPPAIGQRFLLRVLKISDAEYPYSGEPIRKLSVRTDRQLGLYRKVEGEAGRILPVDKKARNEFSVLPGDDASAENSELVAFSVVRDRGRGLIRARIDEKLGQIDEQRNISTIAIHQHNIPNHLPEPVLQAAENLPVFKPGNRTDLRDLPFLTIDPPDARDHDDALWAAPDDTKGNSGGIKVIVAIADVALYVTPQSVLDKEALIRGNSVYFPDQVVPMLPERISNDLCSLRESEDRPAMACFMRFDAKGKKIDHYFDRVVMRSHAKLSYEQAQRAIDGQPDGKTTGLLDSALKPLWAAYEIALKGRNTRKPLELDMPERKLVLDAHGLIEHVVTPDRLDAHKLVEEFMIQANVCAAETLQQKNSPLIYRVHDAPSPEKLTALSDFLRSLDMATPAGQTIKPQHFNAILHQAKGKDHEHLINQVVLRSQAQAIYSPDNLGHFGLNLRHYAHFTSPIRRYADLIVHRALISALKLGSDGLSRDDEERIYDTAEQISGTERRAMIAERETVDRLIASHLKEHVGTLFYGRIGGATRAGLFITLNETGADGFIPISTLDGDYYIHDETRNSLVGERSGETFRMGDKVQVRLVEVTPIAGGMRFEMVSKGSKGKPMARQRPTGKKRHGGPPRGKKRRGPRKK